MRDFIRNIKNQKLRGALLTLDFGPHSAFGLWPASLSYHHAYPGGLAAHTREVCKIAEELANSTSLMSLNRDVILAACVFHDYGKTKEYALVHPDEVPAGRRNLPAFADLVWTKAPCCKTDSDHPHIQFSADELVKLLAAAEVDDGYIRHIEDCILSHHGRKAWGSPFEPKTPEALVVHQADMLSSSCGSTKESSNV